MKGGDKVDGIIECLPVHQGRVHLHITDEMKSYKYLKLVGITSSGKKIPFRTIILNNTEHYDFDIPPYQTFKEVCVVPAKLFYHEPRLFSVNPDDPLEGRDKREHEDRIPIVFIHGLWRVELTPPDKRFGRWYYETKFQTFLHFISALRPFRNKVKIYAYVYPAHYLTLEEHAQNLIDLMKRSKTLSSTPPILIGHSFGGLVAREVARKYPTRSVVTIASPHKGTPIIDYMYMSYSDFKRLWGRMRELMMGLYQIREMLFASEQFVVSPAHEYLLWHDEPYVWKDKVPVFTVAPWLEIDVSPEIIASMLEEAQKNPASVGSYLFSARLMAFMGQHMGYENWSNNDGAVPMESSREGIIGDMVEKLPHIMGDHETPLRATDYFIQHILPAVIT